MRVTHNGSNGKMPRVRWLAVAILVLPLVLHGGPARAWAKPAWAKPVFDLTVQRPLEAVQLAASAVVFVPAYPVAWLFGGERDVYEICLRDPFQRVFDTPLGEL